jgi:hypothetical protein
VIGVVAGAVALYGDWLATTFGCGACVVLEVASL